MKTLEQINLKPKDRRAVEMAASILRGRFPVEEVILFGSKARGDDDADSDIDLLVLTSRRISDVVKRKMTEALFELELELEVVITKLVVPLHEWQHGIYQVAPIRQEVDREGVAA